MNRHWNKGRFALVGVAAALALTAAGCSASPSPTPTDGASGAPAAPVDIVAGIVASAGAAPIYLGMTHGSFSDQGINLTTSPITTGAAAVSSLINGQLNVVQASQDSVINAAASGIPIVVVAGAWNDNTDPKGTQVQAIVSEKSGISSFKDLEGKNVAVNSVSCCWQLWTNEAVEKAGGDPSKVKYVQVNLAQQFSELQAGQIDAAILSQPFATTANQAGGFKSIGDPMTTAFGSPTAQNSVYFMAKSFIDAHPGVVDQFRKALQNASDYTNANPEEAKTAIGKATGTDQALVEASPLPTFTAVTDKDGLVAEAGFLVKYGVLKAAPSPDQYIAP